MAYGDDDSAIGVHSCSLTGTLPASWASRFNKLAILELYGPPAVPACILSGFQGRCNHCSLDACEPCLVIPCMPLEAFRLTQTWHHPVGLPRPCLLAMPGL